MVAAIVLWMIFAVISMKDYLIYFNELNNWNRAMFLLVFIIAGPMFILVNIFTEILDNILPDGWEDNDDDFKGL